eukprot:1716917-Pyramimonas_sp.AAC.2
MNYHIGRSKGEKHCAHLFACAHTILFPNILHAVFVWSTSAGGELLIQLLMLLYAQAKAIAKVEKCLEITNEMTD